MDTRIGATVLMANTVAAPQSVAQQVLNSRNYWQFSIGGILMSDFEVSGAFDIGHELKLAVHEYIAANGQPTIKTESLGSFYVPTSWKGTFFYATALQRALQFDQLMLAGKPVTWIYGPLSYQVVIKKFTVTVEHQLQMDYEIELQVISDSNAQTVGLDTSLSFDAELQDQYSNASVAVSNLITYMVAQSDPSSITIAQTLAPTVVTNVTLTLAQSLIPSIIPTILIDISIALDYAAFLQVIQSAFPLSQQDFTTLQQVVNAANSLINVIQPLLTNLEANAVAEGDLAALTACLEANYNLNLVVENLSQLLGDSPEAVSVVQFTGSLFGLAVQWYPNTEIDVAVGLIAQANSLNDFYVYTPTTISLPPLFQ
jgi:hypothetical protein